MKQIKGGISTMDELCDKFPRVCNCPYKEDIDNYFNNGKTAYFVCNWLKKTDYPISYNTLKKYYDYLKDNGDIKSPKTTFDNEEIDDILLKKLKYAANNVDFDNMNPNVQVQWVLGLYKVLFGDKRVINADINSKVTMCSLFDDALIDEILDGRSDDNNTGGQVQTDNE